MLHQRVAERHAAGDAEVGKDAADELQKAEAAGAAAVEVRQRAHQAQVLPGDIGDVEDGARADGGDHRDALGRLEDERAGGGVEAGEEFPFGEREEIAAVDHLGAMGGERLAGGGAVGAVDIEGGEVVDEAGRGATVVGGDSGGDTVAQFVDAGEAAQADQLTDRDPEDGEESETEEGEAGPAEPRGAGPEILDEAIDGQTEGERDEAPEAGEEHRAPRHEGTALGGQGDRGLGLEGGFRRGDDHRAGAEAGGGAVGGDDDVGGIDAEGAGAARGVGHRRRSPRRNCSVRSRRMWGSERGRPSAVRSNRGGRKRMKARSSKEESFLALGAGASEIESAT